MDTLPTELLEKISGQLSLEDRRRLGQTSRRNRDVYHVMVEREHKKQFGETDKPVVLKVNDLLLQPVLRRLNTNTLDSILCEQYENYFGWKAEGYLNHVPGATITDLAHKLVEVRDKLIANHPDGAVDIRSDFLVLVAGMINNRGWAEWTEFEELLPGGIYEQLVTRLHLLDPSITAAAIDDAQPSEGFERYLYGDRLAHNPVATILANIEELADTYMTTTPNSTTNVSRWSLPGRRRRDAWQNQARSAERVKTNLLETTDRLMKSAQRALSPEDYATLDSYRQHVYRQHEFIPE